MGKKGMPRVRIIATGGTIACKWDPSLGGAVPAATGADLVEALPELKWLAQVEAEQFSNVASHVLTLDNIMALSKRCHQVFQEDAADGIVVTMGTNTQAEYAYMLDLLLREEMPIIVTGAMRNLSLPSPDGPRNLLDSVIAAAGPELRGWGVMVCMNGQLHEPRDVTKTHTLNVATFQSWELGPLGAVANGRVTLYRRPMLKEHIPVDHISARVAVVMAVEDDDGRLIDAAAEFADGIVIAGMGPGHVSPGMVSPVQRAVDKGVTVVRVPRGFGGNLLEASSGYAHPGGDVELEGMGVLPGGSLQAPKARIKLILALSATRDKETLRSMFQNV